MTYENCLKYLKEAKTEQDRLFWDVRIKRKYPDKVVKVEPVVEVQEEEIKSKRGKK
jgi:hypothetical protein